MIRAQSRHLGAAGPRRMTVRPRAKWRGNRRKRLPKRGMVRFKVVVRAKDRGLIRTLAKLLAEKSGDARRRRA